MKLFVFSDIAQTVYATIKTTGGQNVTIMDIDGVDVNEIKLGLNPQQGEVYTIDHFVNFAKSKSLNLVQIDTQNNTNRILATASPYYPFGELGLGVDNI